MLGLAIVTDALLVRMTLVPAPPAALREHSWYIPRRLDRLLPRLTIEPPIESKFTTPALVVTPGPA